MFYEVAIKAARTDENGKEKEVLERYVVDALTFTETEAKANAEYADYQIEFDVVAIKRSNIYEIVNEQSDLEDKLFRAKIISLFIDDNGKEKEQPYYVLLWAANMDDANKKIKEYMRQGMNDLFLKEIKETKILDII